MSSAEENSRHLLTFEDGDTVFAQGDEGGEMFIIEEGRIEILLEGEGEPTSLGILEAGDFFGEMSVLEAGRRTATARSLGRSRLMPVHAAVLTEIVQRSPETALRMMRKLCARIRELQLRLHREVGAVRHVDEAAPAQRPDAGSRPLGGRLVHPSGQDFPLAEDALIGRPDSATGIIPEIDVSEIGGGHSVSRQHARIVHRDGRFYLAEEAGAKNGTRVNGERLGTGESRELHHGDLIRLGEMELTVDLTADRADAVTPRG